MTENDIRITEIHNYYREMLEQIREEIEFIMPKYGDGTGWEEGRRNAVIDVLKIIDKYIKGDN